MVRVVRTIDFSSWQAIAAAGVGVGGVALHHGDAVDADEGPPPSGR